MFRVVVQDARRTPTSGNIVAQLGSYDPHSKTVTLDKEKAGFYLEHGAQPSERAASLLKKEGVKLPAWVKDAPKRESSVRNADKRRSTRPDEPEAEAPAKEPAAETEAPAEEAPAEEPTAEPETPAEESVEAPAKEAAESDEKEAE